MRGLFLFCSRLFSFYLTSSYRIEYDAYRHDYEILLARVTSGENLSSADEFAQQQYEHFKNRYEKCKDDVKIKLKLLEENRVCIPY